MKKIFNIILMVICLSSCERHLLRGDLGSYRYEEHSEKTTDAGYMAYNEIRPILIQAAKEIEMIQKTTMYQQANEQDKDSVKADMLEDYKILIKKNGNVLLGYNDVVYRYNSQTIYYEITHSEALNTKWTVHNYLFNGDGDTLTIAKTIIENTQENIWMYCSEYAGDAFYDKPNYSVKFKIAKTSDNEFDNKDINNYYSYSSTGADIGTITSDKKYNSKLITEYQIEETLEMLPNEDFESSNNFETFDKGKIKMNVAAYEYKVNSKPDITDTITAKILNSKQVEISMRGVADTWAQKQ